MTTAQQLGLVGNSVKVQTLPTASAETFGQGNRFYTLIGQQTGYITGHTYRTVVANDVYSWEDVASTTDYNEIENIPVINQDLTVSGFTPVANTYYRHTGTTDTYTQGVIYYYDGSEYKALDGSGGGGTTLNKYTYTTSDSTSSYTRFFNIVKNAKIVKYIINSDYEPVNYSFEGQSNLRLYTMSLVYQGTFSSMTGKFIRHSISSIGTKGTTDVLTVKNTLTDGTNVTSSTGTQTSSVYYKYTVVYYNDTEITE